jgi:hypothetical protein
MTNFLPLKMPSTEISEPSPNNVEKVNTSKDHAVSEKFLGHLESIQIKTDDKNEPVTILNNLVMNSGALK